MMTLFGCQYVAVRVSVDCPPAGRPGDGLRVYTAKTGQGSLGTVQVHARYQQAASSKQSERVLWLWAEALECFDAFDCFGGFERMFGLTFSKAGGSQPTHRSGPFRVISSRRSLSGVRHKLHTMLQPSSKVSKGPTQDPLPPRPICCFICADPFRPAAQHTQDTPTQHPAQPGPATLRPLRDPAILPSPSLHHNLLNTTYYTTTTTITTIFFLCCSYRPPPRYDQHGASGVCTCVWTLEGVVAQQPN